MLVVDRPSGITITPEGLAELVALYGHSLPTDYLDFIEATNGGYIDLDDDERAQVCDYKIPPSGRASREVMSQMYFVGDERVNPNLGSVATSTRRLQHSGLAPGMLAIGEGVSAFYFCMQSVDRGAVYAFPQDNGMRSCGIFIAKSFSEFCKMVYRHPYHDV